VEFQWRGRLLYFQVEAMSFHIVSSSLLSPYYYFLINNYNRFKINELLILIINSVYTKRKLKKRIGKKITLILAIIV